MDTWSSLTFDTSSQPVAAAPTKCAAHIADHDSDGTSSYRTNVLDPTSWSDVMAGITCSARPDGRFAAVLGHGVGNDGGVSRGSLPVYLVQVSTDDDDNNNVLQLHRATCVWTYTDDGLVDGVQLRTLHFTTSMTANAR